MKTLETLSSRISERTAKRFAWIFAALSFLGFLDASYLTFEHYTGAPLPCAIFTGCATVTTSQYAAIGGIPVALLGALYYLAVLIFTLAFLENDSRRSLAIAALITPFGFLASLWFVYLQLFIIKALCLYCVVSATTSTLLFISAMRLIILAKSARIGSIEDAPK